MSFTERDGIVRCQAFDDQFEWQHHGFGTRQANPILARQVVTLRQVHSAIVHEADGLRDREIEGDALVTGRVACAVGVRTADCVPILLLDARTRTVACVHAGWRGTAAQIVAWTVEKLARDNSSGTSHVHAAIGPCIRSCCYEVSEDVAAQFERWPDGIHRRARAKPHLDLAGINRAQLIQADVATEHILDCGLCTACDPGRFFSYRRDPGNPGRMISAIVRTA